ncbi:MAG: hypothetical protein KDD84_24300, partial [Caldilineaceae bacterium]|nr:hypothetical protein [Caldilineaceae bacterium]
QPIDHGSQLGAIGLGLEEIRIRGEDGLSGSRQPKAGRIEKLAGSWLGVSLRGRFLKRNSAHFNRVAASLTCGGESEFLPRKRRWLRLRVLDFPWIGVEAAI